MDTSTTILGEPAALPARLRAHRLHPDDAHRGRARGRPGGRADRASRTRCPRWAPRRSRGSPPRRPDGTPVVPAVPVARPGGEPRLRRRGPGEPGYEALVLTVDTPVAGPRLRDVRNGLTIPPSLSLRTVRRGRAAPGLVVRPAHHRAAGVRLAQPLRRHRRRARRHACSTRPRRSPTSPGCERPGTDRWSSRASRPSPTPARSSTPAPTPSSCPTTAAVSSTGRRPRWRCCPRWSTRSATAPRSTSTAASCPAATSSPRSPSAPGRRWSAGPTCTA